MIIKEKAHARAGLIGNPSDGYFGKTISVILKNFSAVVTMWESPELHIELGVRDKSTFRSMNDLRDLVYRYGYYAGLRLIEATIKRFGDYCEEHGIELPNRNFTVRYDSNIPRHVGLAGSSAIITAALRALCRFYEVTIPKEIQPTLVLSVETEELGISAGLQDRVIQVYEGVVFMDFDRALMEETGHGRYEPLSPELLPRLFVAYRTDLGEGSEVFHNHIRERFEAGEEEVVQAMKRFASFAQESSEALLAAEPERLGPLMNANFDLRAAIYPISERNRDLVMRGRELGAHVKFSGSGGAVIGTYEDEDMYAALEKSYVEGGYKILKPRIE